MRLNCQWVQKRTILKMLWSSHNQDKLLLLAFWRPCVKKDFQICTLDVREEDRTEAARLLFESCDILHWKSVSARKPLDGGHTKAQDPIRVTHNIFYLLPRSQMHACKQTLCKIYDSVAVAGELAHRKFAGQNMFCLSSATSINGYWCCSAAQDKAYSLQRSITRSECAWRKGLAMKAFLLSAALDMLHSQIGTFIMWL